MPVPPLLGDGDHRLKYPSTGRDSRGDLFMRHPYPVELRDDIREWCKEMDFQVFVGMAASTYILDFDDADAAFAFKMRWG